MKAHLASAYNLFTYGCTRAYDLKAIHEYLTKSAPAAMNCDDILRSALVLVVSSFDLYVHDVFRLEVLQRLSLGKDIAAYRVPFNALHLQSSERDAAIEECIRKENAHKSFVAPEKVAECLRSLLDNPWEVVALYFGSEVKSCKAKLKSVVDLRNRIAHEADVNPAYGGVELWPIYGEDVVQSIDFLRKLGLAIAEALSA